MSKPPAVQLYAADFFMDTNGWTAAQVGAYFRLLMTEWTNGSLSPDINDLARIAGVDPRNMQKMWSTVLAKKFTTDSSGMLINVRLEKEREKQIKYRESRAIGGHAKHKKDGACAEHVQTGCTPLQSSTPSSLEDKNKTPLPPERETVTLDQEYEEIYKSRPLLKQIHAVPNLRTVTLEIFLKCIQRRHKYLNWEKAVQFVCDRAELETNIRSPGGFLDKWLGIYEKDHLANCQSREAEAKQRERDLAAYIEYCKEFDDDPDRLEFQKKEMLRQYGQSFIEEAERVLPAHV